MPSRHKSRCHEIRTAPFPDQPMNGETEFVSKFRIATVANLELTRRA